MKTIPVLLLTGYLGSGKTTLVNHILTNERGIRFAVIVNDIGEVNIDADLIQRGGIVGKKDQSLVALQNGCICCTLQTDLIEQINEIIEMDRFDYIVIEASGICEPAPIAQTIAMMPRMDADKYRNSAVPRLDCICTVVDALRLYDEFAGGDDLRRDNLDEEDIENLIIQQIEFCNIILLNKVSELTVDQAQHVRRIVREIQPVARIIDCDYANVDLDLLINTHLFNFERVANSAAWVKGIDTPAYEDEQHPGEHDHDEHDEHDHHEHDEHDHDHDEHDHHDHDEHDHHDHDEHDHHGHGHHHHHHHHDEGEAEEYGIGTFVYFRRKPFDLNKFDYFLDKQWPKSVIRAKGVCYFKQNEDMSYLFESAGRQKKITEAGLWYATAQKDELYEMARQDPTIMRDWDEIYGDRMQKIVFIGQKMDRQAITDALDACLTNL